MALAGPPRSYEKELPPRLFSHQCLEEKFCELRHYGVLRSSHDPYRLSQSVLRIALHSGPFRGLGDCPNTISSFLSRAPQKVPARITVLLSFPRSFGRSAPCRASTVSRDLRPRSQVRGQELRALPQPKVRTGARGPHLP